MSADLPRLLRELDVRIQQLERWPDAQLREQVFAVLQLVDAVHRTPVARLAARLEAGGAWPELLDDDAIRLLFALYDAVPLEDHDADPPPTWIELPVVPASAGGASALRAPAFREVAELGRLSEEAPHLLHLDGRALLLVRLGGDAYAYEARCPACGGSLEGAVVTAGGPAGAGVIVCPWQNCAFDSRSGRRVDGGAGGHLRAVPLRIHDGRVLLATGAAPGTRSGEGA